MYRAALVARCLRGKPARRFALISRPWGAFRLGANIVSACPSVMPRREAQKHLGAAKLRFLAAQFVIRASNGVSLSVNAGNTMAIDVGEHNRDNAFVAWTRIQAGHITLRLLVKSQTGIPTPVASAWGCVGCWRLAASRTPLWPIMNSASSGSPSPIAH